MQSVEHLYVTAYGVPTRSGIQWQPLLVNHQYLPRREQELSLEQYIEQIEAEGWTLARIRAETVQGTATTKTLLFKRPKRLIEAARLQECRIRKQDA